MLSLEELKFWYLKARYTSTQGRHPVSTVCEFGRRAFGSCGKISTWGFPQTSRLHVASELINQKYTAIQEHSSDGLPKASAIGHPLAGTLVRVHKTRLWFGRFLHGFRSFSFVYIMNLCDLQVNDMKGDNWRVAESATANYAHAKEGVLAARSCHISCIILIRQRTN